MRLILDKLPPIDLILYGDASINNSIIELLEPRHHFTYGLPEKADVALVINDPAAANRIADIGMPIIYVDSLPYLWATGEEVPNRNKVDCYCAQKFPADRLPVSNILEDWQEIHWVDPIVPPHITRRGGGGVVINVGGLHSHLAGNSVRDYLSLVLIPLVNELNSLKYPISAVCGNIPDETCRQLRDLLPDCPDIGRLSPYDFEGKLQLADHLFTSPGSTTILQAMALSLPTLLLPPQNLSQTLNARLFSLPGASIMEWPASVMAANRIEQLRPKGEDAVLEYFYQSICAAAASDRKTIEVCELIRSTVRTMPKQGVIDQKLMSLGSNGAYQIASLVEEVLISSPRHQPTHKPSTS